MFRRWFFTLWVLQPLRAASPFNVTTYIDQMPTYLVLKKVHSMPVSEFSTDEFHKSSE
jgi:hypothetical protein